MAIWLATRTFRRFCLCSGAVDLSLLSLSAVTMLLLDRAGSSPTATPVRSETPSANASTLPSIEISDARCEKRAASCESVPSAEYASSRPTAPLISVSSTLSTTSICTMRPRLEPTAMRTVSSLRR